MTKQRKWFWTGMSTLALASVVGVGLAMLKHEPHFYRQSLAVKGDDSKELSKKFVGQMTTMIGYLLDGKGSWDFTITQEEINSYFDEDFIALGESETLRKHGIHEPRLLFEDDKLRLAFRYGSGPLATVISYDLRVWLAPKEVNVMAIEIMAKRAGAIPMSSQSLLDGIADVVRTKGIEVTWYRRDSNPVALVRFQPDRPHRTARLLRLAVRQGSLTIAGHSGEEATVQGPARSPLAAPAPPPLAPPASPPLALTPANPPPPLTPSVPPAALTPPDPPSLTPSVPPLPVTPSVSPPPLALPTPPPLPLID